MILDDGGGVQGNNFAWELGSDARQPDFCSTASSYKSASNQTLSGKGKRTGGRADRCSWMLFTKLTDNIPALS